jgi:ATP-dependent DNA helicase RecQ
MDKMIEYVSEEDTCRSAYLLEYFGQTESADCGTCDICRAKSSGIRKNSSASALASEIKTYINDDLAGEYRINDILSRFAVSGSLSNDECISILRKLIDSSEVPAPIII